METLLLIIVGIAIALWSSYRLARRSPVLGSMIALLLLVGSFLVIRLDLGPASLGDGAPSSAGAFIGLLWLLEAGGILLAGTLFMAGWRGQDNPLSKTLFLFVFLPFSAYAVWSALPKPNPTAKPVQRNGNGPIQQGMKKDGYVWAIDNQFLDETDCKNGTPEFLAGCKEGVAKNQARRTQ